MFVATWAGIVTASLTPILFSCSMYPASDLHLESSCGEDLDKLLINTLFEVISLLVQAYDFVSES